MRQRKNRIEPLKNEQGEWVEEKIGLKNMAIKHCTDLFTSDPKTGGSFIRGMLPSLEVSAK